jgi:hypothetical protein
MGNSVCIFESEITQNLNLQHDLCGNLVSRSAFSLFKCTVLNVRKARDWWTGSGRSLEQGWPTWWDPGGKCFRPSVTWIFSVVQFNKHKIIGLQNIIMATLLADKMFTNYNSSLLIQHTVNQSFSVFYRALLQPATLPSLNRTFSVNYCL